MALCYSWLEGKSMKYISITSYEGGRTQATEAEAFRYFQDRECSSLQGHFPEQIFSGPSSKTGKSYSEGGQYSQGKTA
jgi:hypothetical protein